MLDQHVRSLAHRVQAERLNRPNEAEMRDLWVKPPSKHVCILLTYFLVPLLHPSLCLLHFSLRPLSLYLFGAPHHTSLVREPGKVARGMC